MTVAGSMVPLISTLCVTTIGDVTFSSTAVTAGIPRSVSEADICREFSVVDKRVNEGAAEGTGG